MLISEAYAAFEVSYLINKDKKPKTIKEYRYSFFGRNGIISTVGDIPLEYMGLDHVIRWKMHLREEGLKPAYINHCLSQFRWFLKWCGENEMRTFDWRKVTFDSAETAKPHTTLTEDEIERLVKATKTLRDKAIIQLLFGSGIRSNELIQLNRYQWQHASLVNHKEIVEHGAMPIWEIYVLGKNSKWRPVCIFNDVKLAVDMYLDSRADAFEPLFISQQNRRIHHNTISLMLHKATATAGLTKHVTQHTLRHSYVTEKAAQGVPTAVLSYNIGHSSEATTQKIYTHIKQMHVRRALAQYSAK
jgi:integrase/recombinase XerC